MTADEHSARSSTMAATSVPVTSMPATSVSGSDEARIAVARRVLGARTGTDADAFTLVSVDSVVWPSSALGCPRYGVTYELTPVPGYRIVLALGDVEYTLHGADGGGDPFVCEFLDS